MGVRFSPDIDDYLKDMWEYNIVDQTWNELKIAEPEPTPSKGFSTANIDNEKMLIFGGNISGVSEDQEWTNINELWEYTIQSRQWNPLYHSGDIPPASELTTMVYIGNDTVFLVSVDTDDTESHTSRFYTYSISANKWTKLTGFETKPGHREGPSLVYSADRKKIFLVGGWSNATGSDVTLDDFWEYNTVTKSWIEIDDGENAPPSRTGHVMVLSNNRILIHGGGHNDSDGTTEYLGDVWIYYLGQPET